LTPTLRVRSDAVVPSVFISYRRESGASDADLVCDRLRQRLGDSAVFIDDRSIESGTTWPTVIEEALRAAIVVVVIIGPTWLEARDQNARRKIDDRKNDWVRREIELALDESKCVIPVLFGGVSMPSADALPRRLRGLSRHQACAIQRASRDKDLDRLVDRVQRAVGEAGAR
jgi:hypothetical protein